MSEFRKAQKLKTQNSKLKTPANQAWRLWYPLIFALAYSQEALFSSNQNTKFITGLALAGYRDIAADWMAGITDPFPLFSHLLALQYRFLGLHAGTHLIFLLLAGAYAFLALRLARDLLKHLDSGKMALPAFALLWLAAHTVGLREAFQSVLPDGLAGQYLLGDYYQPCCFGVLLLAAVWAYASGRLLAAAACLTAAPLFHPAYLISSALIAAALVIVPANRGLGLSWPRRIVFLCLTGAGVGAYALWNYHSLTSGDPAVRDAAYRLMAETRIPQHALPSHWNLFKTISFFMAGAAAAWLGRRHLFGQILFALLALIAVAIAVSLISFNPTMAVAAPWRVSAMLAPLSWIVLLAAAAQRLARIPFFAAPSRKILKLAAVACIGACLTGVLHLGLDYKNKEQRKYYALSRFLEEYHRPGFQYLVPPEEKSIRLEAGVPVYATLKSHPTKDSEFLAWRRRIEAAQAVYGGSGAELQRLSKEEAVTHVVWPAEKGDFPFTGYGSRLYGDKYFSLWELGEEKKKFSVVSCEF